MLYVLCAGSRVSRDDALDDGAYGRRVHVDRVPYRRKMESGRTAAALSVRMSEYYVSGAFGRQHRQLPDGAAYLGLHFAAVSFQGTNLSRFFSVVVRAVHTGRFSVRVPARSGQFDAKKSRIPFAIAVAMES